MSAIERCRTAALGGHVARCAGLLAHDDRLQQLPQPALPEVPGRSRKGVARGPPGRAAASAVLPCRVHAAGRGRRHRLPEQGRDLRHPVQGFRRDADHHRRRSEASRCQDRHHIRAAHLGLGDDPPSARPHDRARRWSLARRPELDPVQAELLPARARALEAVPAGLPGEARRCPRGRSPRVLRRSQRALRAPTHSPPIWPRCAGPSGSSTRSGRSQDPRRCSPTCPATPTGSPSPTAG